MRKWNLNIHICRIHPGQYDAWSRPKRGTSQDTPRNTRTTSNSLWPDRERDSPDYRSAELENLLQQIKRLNPLELTILLRSVINELNR